RRAPATPGPDATPGPRTPPRARVVPLHRRPARRPACPPRRSPAKTARPQYGRTRAADCIAGTSVHEAERHSIGPRRAEEGVPGAGLDRRIEADLAVGLVGEVASDRKSTR